MRVFWRAMVCDPQSMRLGRRYVDIDEGEFKSMKNN